MGHVKEPGPFTNRAMFGNDPGFILYREEVTPKGDYFSSVSFMPFIERGIEIHVSCIGTMLSKARQDIKKNTVN